MSLRLSWKGISEQVQDEEKEKLILFKESVIPNLFRDLFLHIVDLKKGVQFLGLPIISYLRSLLNPASKSSFRSSRSSKPTLILKQVLPL